MSSSSKLPKRFLSMGEARRFVEKLDQEQQDELSEILDEIVHDIKSGEAAEINNQGTVSQMEYIGDPSEIWEALCCMMSHEEERT